MNCTLLEQIESFNKKLLEQTALKQTALKMTEGEFVEGERLILLANAAGDLLTALKKIKGLHKMNSVTAAKAIAENAIAALSKSEWHG